MAAIFAHSECWILPPGSFARDNRNANGQVRNRNVRISAYARWWEPFFDGYGKAPDFELFRLRLLGATGAEYLDSWAGTREQILTDILNAQSWEDLFLKRAG